LIGRFEAALELWLEGAQLDDVDARRASRGVQSAPSFAIRPRTTRPV